MSKKAQLVCLLFTTLILSSQLVWSAATCRISGSIVDANTNKPLFGANVILEGTSIGAATDINGMYSIVDVPAGYYTLKVSYLGYHTEKAKIHLDEGEHLEENFKLKTVGVVGKTVVVTAQASGQNAAINQQLSSDNIVNVVSAAKIQELPDANAAESVGRLPGIYLLRSGGEGYEVAIRGLQPKYNEIMIDGVQMAATSGSNRSVDMSMISSSTLSGIEVYKTVTPDMDAAVLGGVVNFQIREAQSTPSGLPEINISAQGGYNYLQNTYNKDYKFTAGIGKRYFDNKLGIFAQVVVERKNLTYDELGAGYNNLHDVFNSPITIGSVNLSFHPSIRNRYDGTLVMDYRLPHGKIDFMNFLSTGKTNNQTLSQDYQLENTAIYYNAGFSQNTLNTITNLIDFKQNMSLFDMDLKVSHSYSENISPDTRSIQFWQTANDLRDVSEYNPPQQIAQYAYSQVNLNNLFLHQLSTSYSFSKQRNITGSLDLKRNFDISRLVTATLKLGGKYKYTYRWYDSDNESGLLDLPYGANLRAYVLQNLPWMTQPPYNMPSNGSKYFRFTMFEDNNFSYGKFFNGDYSMGPGTNLGLASQIIDLMKSYGVNPATAALSAYRPSWYNILANDYSGNEYENAGYIMATINIGQQIVIIPGVRYQGLETAYKANRFYNADAPNNYPLPWPHQDTTITEYHGFWLPDISIRYKPLSWFDIRAAYTNTITYPDYSSIIPIIDVFSASATWNNYELKPAHSQNYDLALSFYNNSIGLFTADGFLKQIDNLIFGSGGVYITDPSKYPGLPSYTKGFLVSTDINNPYRVNVRGMEFNWQTHFWYLPWVLSGLVLNVNYTHIFSQAHYPYVITEPGHFPTWLPTYIDSNYTDRIIDQPNSIINLSIGYDYAGFSIEVSMINQANVFKSTNFWPQLRKDKAKYLRWDLAAKQDLPWPGLQVYLNLNDLNNASDIYVVRGSGFPSSESNYGLTASLGFRWNFK